MAFGFSMPSLSQRLQSLSQTPNGDALAQDAMASAQPKPTPAPSGSAAPPAGAPPQTNPLDRFGHDMMNVVRGFSGSGTTPSASAAAPAAASAAPAVGASAAGASRKGIAELLASIFGV